MEAEPDARTCRQDAAGTAGSQCVAKTPKYQGIPGYSEAGMSSGTVRVPGDRAVCRQCDILPQDVNAVWGTQQVDRSTPGLQERAVRKECGR